MYFVPVKCFTPFSNNRMLLYKFENSSCKSFIACLLLAPEEDAEDVKTERTTSWYVFVKGLRTGKRKGENIEQSV